MHRVEQITDKIFTASSKLNILDSLKIRISSNIKLNFSEDKKKIWDQIKALGNEGISMAKEKKSDRLAIDSR